MEYWSEFQSLIIVITAGLISPGPNFALVLRNSLLLSRRNAMYTVIGATTATSLQVMGVIFGLGVLLCEVPQAFKVVQFCGGIFLLYLGLQGWGLSLQKALLFLTGQRSQPSDTPQLKDIAHQGQSCAESARVGFITSILNPMSFVFYASVFTAVSTHTPLMIKLIYAAIIVAQFGTWFIIVGLFFSNKRVQDVFNNYRDWINRLTGTVLIYFSYNLISGALQ